MLTILTSGMVVAILYFARDILVPFALAVLLVFLLAPAVRLLRRLGVGRPVAVSVTVLIAFVVLLGFASIVLQEVASLGRSLPEYRANLEAMVHTLPTVIPGTGVIHRAATMLRDLRNELARSGTEPAAAAGHSSGGDHPSAASPKIFAGPNHAT